MSVEPLSPAGKAGLKELDVVTSFDGKSVQNIVDLPGRKNQQRSNFLKPTDMAANQFQ
ncbi:hypothetical protein CGLO_11813 [Colletotrichum gloeosporioides Cg-14]|uniref:PDZ domain-containing protein n=1 Tax=Colletotrichum gloeosporioides (strain Cg-14) TaxID=1237896 RepID=T0KA81_COLGC|nr:hypothetical protein CGLO_11813 [Colletotrichum gloeosporioides Cg-14]